MTITIEVSEELAARLTSLPEVHDLNAFAVAAITEKIETMEAATIESEEEYAETLAAIRQGAADITTGKLYTLEEARGRTDAALAEYRRHKGMVE